MYGLLNCCIKAILRCGHISQSHLSIVNSSDRGQFQTKQLLQARAVNLSDQLEHEQNLSGELALVKLVNVWIPCEMTGLHSPAFAKQWYCDHTSISAHIVIAVLV